MSIFKKYATKTYTKTEKVMISEKRYCDVCDKEITGSHWEITTGHNDWGNDSCDSIETFDICSASCLKEAFENYIKESDKITSSQWLEIKHERGSCVRGEIKYNL